MLISTSLVDFYRDNWPIHHVTNCLATIFIMPYRWLQDMVVHNVTSAFILDEYSSSCFETMPSWYDCLHPKQSFKKRKNGTLPHLNVPAAVWITLLNASLSHIHVLVIGVFPVYGHRIQLFRRWNYLQLLPSCFFSSENKLILFHENVTANQRQDKHQNVPFLFKSFADS